MITIYVGNIRSRIEGSLSYDVTEEISKTCSYLIDGAMFSKLYKEHKWDGRKKLYSVMNQSFPTGLLSLVRDVLDRNYIKYTITDSRLVPFTSNIPFNPPFTLRNYQNHAIDLVLRKTRGIIKIGTAGGKSVCIAGAISKTNVNTLILVHMNSLLSNIVKEIGDCLDVPVGIIAEGVFSPEKITVAMVQSLTEVVNKKGRNGKYRKVFQIKKEAIPYLKSVQCLVMDEIHHSSADTYQMISDECPNAYYRFGVTATPFREDNATLLINGITGRILCDYGASYLIENQYISKPTIHIKPFKQAPLEGKIKYGEAYDKHIVRNMERNRMIVDLASKLMEENKSVMISIRIKDHGKILERMLREKYQDLVISVDGDSERELLKQTLVNLDNKTILCAIASSVYNEGINVRGLDSLIIASAPDSRVLSLQLIGRVLRKTATKNTVDVFDICDIGSRFFGNHSRNRIKTYKTEPGFVIDTADFPSVNLRM